MVGSHYGRMLLWWEGETIMVGSHYGRMPLCWETVMVGCHYGGTACLKGACEQCYLPFTPWSRATLLQTPPLLWHD